MIKVIAIPTNIFVFAKCKLSVKRTSTLDRTENNESCKTDQLTHKIDLGSFVSCTIRWCDPTNRIGFIDGELEITG